MKMDAKKLLILCLSACGVNANAAGLSYDFEGNSEDWASRGSASIELSTNYAHSGSQSLYVSNRSQSWEGAFMQNDYIEAGETYDFGVWVYGNGYGQINLSLEYSDNGNAQYKGIGSATINGGSWAYISGRYTIPEGAEGIKPYLESSEASLSFYVDDYTCEKLVTEDLELTEPPLKDLFAEYFKIGTAVTATEITPKNAKQLVLHHFNSVTPGNELKPDNMLDQANSISKGDNVNPQVKISSDTRTVLKFCSDNKIPIRGHVMVWHSQTPDWFFNENFQSNGALVSVEIMNQRMENYIKNVMELVTTEFPDLQIYAWDIVNECFRNDQGMMREPGSNNQEQGKSRWMSVYGNDSFIYNAFEYARKYAPSGCKLYYNDYNEYIDSKRDGIYELVKNLYDKGLCDGIGMQSHLSTDFPSVQLYRQALEKYATIGCDIQITELDITLGDNATFETQAKMYKDLFDLYREYSKNISLVAVWGTNDEISWRKEGQPLLFENYKPKPAFFSIIDGMDWTEVNDVLSNGGVAVSPSCTSDNVNIFCAGDFTYCVNSASGQLTTSGKATDMATVNLSSQPSGIYMINVSANGSQNVMKVVKK